MLEETKDNQISEETSLAPISETALAEARANLSIEAQRLIGELTSEKDKQKMQAIEQQFNDIQRKKQIARVSKLSDVQDMLTDQFYRRISERPDEISNKEMLDGMKVVQDLMEKNLKQAETIEEIPQLIQINQTEVNVGNNLNRDSRERVKNAVIDILNSINKTQPISEEPDYIEAEFKEEEEDNG
jgi:DNA-binding FadR family transcriptional regulator